MGRGISKMAKPELLATIVNGALAGAVLGARYGASAIPLRWTSHVVQRERLADLADRLSRL